MIIWNFINSKDFLILLNKGGEVNKIPSRLNYIWQRNKIIFYIVTTVIYLVLIVSEFFVTSNMSILDRSDIRIKTSIIFMLILIVNLVALLSIKYLYKNFKIFKIFLDKRKDSLIISKLLKVIEYYTRYHKYIIKSNNKKNKRRKNNV
ncbi:hypothetical protein D8846_09235 [Streptococcus oralis]|nr:hypothetical protein D8846_09235 [Streptococcus oralis]